MHYGICSNQKRKKKYKITQKYINYIKHYQISEMKREREREKGCVGVCVCERKRDRQRVKYSSGPQIKLYFYLLFPIHINIYVSF